MGSDLPHGIRTRCGFVWVPPLQCAQSVRDEPTSKAGRNQTRHWDGNWNLGGVCFDIIANFKECGLRFSVLAQFFYLTQAWFGLLFFALKSPLGFVALPLLASLFLLALVECGPASWHRNTPVWLIDRHRQQTQTTFLRISRTTLNATSEVREAGARGRDSRHVRPGDSSKAATITRAFSLGPRFVDRKCASAEVRPVQSRDGLFGFTRIRHLDKCEAARPTSFALCNYADSFNSPSTRFRGDVSESRRG